jgi:hypothetical protein
MNASWRTGDHGGVPTGMLAAPTLQKTLFEEGGK